MEHKIVAVVAIGKNRELGNADKLLWHIPEDLKRFKELTLGHPIIMGRKTFESIVSYIGKPLPNRTNIVVTRDPSYRGPTSVVTLADGSDAWDSWRVLVASSLEAAIEIAKREPGSEEIHIGGGAQIYREALPLIDRLHLTIVDDAPLADTFFPEYEQEFEPEAPGMKGESNGISYTWMDLSRKSSN